MRALGYRVVDMIVDHFDGLSDEPAGRQTDRGTLEALLREPPPEYGADPEAVLGRLRDDVLAHMGRVDHPRFFGFVPGPGNFVGVLGEALAAGFNVFAGTWFESSGPAVLELVTVDWLRQWCGLPDRAGGLFVSGGSMANLTALAAARHASRHVDASRAVAYCSDQTHSAVDRGLRVLGYRADQLRKLPTDEQFRIDVSALERAVDEDRGDGREPFCVIVNAGTTNTGAVDPFHAIADLCEREGMWLHADAAYGGPAVLCEEGRVILEGLERSDSIALDPHKWLFQPFEIGCVLCRDRRYLRETFAIRPDYLRDVEGVEDEVNFADYGVQLSRGFRALKLWLSIQVFGVAAFRQAIERGLENACHAEAALRRTGRWEIVAPAQLGVVAFRYASPDGSREESERVSRSLVDAAQRDGFTLVSSTVLRGSTALRMCPINPRTSLEDIEASVERLGELAAAL